VGYGGKQRFCEPTHPPHRQRVGSAGRLDHREDACPTINLMDGKESQRDLPSSGSPCPDRLLSLRLCENRVNLA
jgi:hypothetical protein